MKKIALLLIYAILTNFCYGQTKKLFADREKPIMKFRALAQKEWDNNNSAKALSYSDSIRNCIIGSYVADYQFITLGNKSIDTKEIKIPILITVSASWCEPCKAEITALNKLSAEYSHRIYFIVLFWDTKDGLHDLAKKYSKNIILIPSLKKIEGAETTIDISGFRHIIGYPTNYFIDNHQIVDLDNNGAQVAGSYTDKNGKPKVITEEMADNFNYNKLKKELDKLAGINSKD